jgi:hypothetical protein
MARSLFGSGGPAPSAEYEADEDEVAGRVENLRVDDDDSGNDQYEDEEDEE